MVRLVIGKCNLSKVLFLPLFPIITIKGIGEWEHFCRFVLWLSYQKATGYSAQRALKLIFILEVKSSEFYNVARQSRIWPFSHENFRGKF